MAKRMRRSIKNKGEEDHLDPLTPSGIFSVIVLDLYFGQHIHIIHLHHLGSKYIKEYIKFTIIYFKFINIYFKCIINWKFYYFDKLKIHKNVLNDNIESLERKGCSRIILKIAIIAIVVVEWFWYRTFTQSADCIGTNWAFIEEWLKHLFLMKRSIFHPVISMNLKCQSWFNKFILYLFFIFQLAVVNCNLYLNNYKNLLKYML